MITFACGIFEINSAYLKALMIQKACNQIEQLLRKPQLTRSEKIQLVAQIIFIPLQMVDAILPKVIPLTPLGVAQDIHTVCQWIRIATATVSVTKDLLSTTGSGKSNVVGLADGIASVLFRIADYYFLDTSMPNISQETLENYEWMVLGAQFLSYVVAFRNNLFTFASRVGNVAQAALRGTVASCYQRISTAATWLQPHVTATVQAINQLGNTIINSISNSVIVQNLSSLANTVINYIYGQSSSVGSTAVTS